MDLRLRELRKDRHLTQLELGKLVGVSLRVVSAWERRETEITLDDAARVADILHCTLDELAGRDFPAASSLAPDEQRLVDTYRSAPGTQRPSILAVSETLAGDAGEIQSVRRRIS